MSRLFVLLGATGIGKTNLSIDIAQHLACPIISSDSRQIYREMSIGTAVPSEEQLQTVQHFFIHSRSIFDDYTAGKFEIDALKLISELFATHKNLLMVGGSGLYIDAVCRGIDEIPGTDKDLRNTIIERYKNEGLDALVQELKNRDSEICNYIDIKNPQRVMRALEACIVSGKPYSSLRQNFSKTRNFAITKIGLRQNRDELYDRINRRVDEMFADGLEKEAKFLYEYRNVNALQTVGYKELFEYFDDKISLEQAKELIKRNTRRYAKRQTTWFARYNDITWFEANEKDKILEFINQYQ